MSPVDMLIVAAAFAVVALGLTAAFAWQQRRQERFILALFDRFLARHFEELTMGQMIGKEVEVDQQVEASEDSEDDVAIREWSERMREQAEREESKS